MPHSTAPKEKIRKWMQSRQRDPKPPPDMKEIRRMLGFELIEMARNKRFR